MFVNKLLCVTLVSFCACTFQSADLKKGSEIVKQYLVTFKKGQPVDTSLHAEYSYNSKGELKKAIDYFRKSVLKTSVFVDGDTIDLKKFLSKSDSITYVVKSKCKESDLYNGKIIGERFYDADGNIKRQTSYDHITGLVTVTEDFVYSYDHNGKRNTEVLLWNKDTISAVRYVYKDSLLVEKYYLKNKCCDKSQPISVDKIVYEYDEKKNLSKEMAIIDRKIERDYKKENNGYYNEVAITTYLYDSLNRLINKKVYTPNFSDDLNSKVSQLLELPTTLQEAYFYKYY